MLCVLLNPVRSDQALTRQARQSLLCRFATVMLFSCNLCGSKADIRAEVQQRSSWGMLHLVLLNCKSGVARPWSAGVCYFL